MSIPMIIKIHICYLWMSSVGVPNMNIMLWIIHIYLSWFVEFHQWVFLPWIFSPFISAELWDVLIGWSNLLMVEYLWWIFQLRLFIAIMDIHIILLNILTDVSAEKNRQPISGVYSPWIFIPTMNNHNVLLNIHTEISSHLIDYSFFLSWSSCGCYPCCWEWIIHFYHEYSYWFLIHPVEYSNSYLDRLVDFFRGHSDAIYAVGVAVTALSFRQISCLL